MLRSISRLGAVLSLLGILAPAQQFGDVDQKAPSADSRLVLKYAQFDPSVELPAVPVALRSAADTSLWVVQFEGQPSEAGRRAIREAGGQLHSYLPHNAYVVRMPAANAASVGKITGIRFVGYYEPAYRLEPFLVQELVSGNPVPERKYNIVVVNKRTDKPALVQGILALGGKVEDMHEGGLLLTVSLDMQGLLGAARLDEVLWIDRWTPDEIDMNNARIQGGGNYVETSGGYTGSGIRGHVYEGVESNHPDFNIVMTNVSSGGAAQAHGHCTAGIVFGNGTSTPGARGMAPNARGYYTNYSSAVGSRNSIINTVVNTHNCMFTTASWGGARTLAYTSTSADSDDVIFDHRIPWTQSQSNAGNQMSRPQAWAKNIFSIGGVRHGDNANPLDDTWSGGGSTGPAADGRIKPDLCAYYDKTLTSDLTGGAGYSSGNFYTNFGGTSGATPIVAGHNALAIQMFTDGIFGNPMRVPGGTRFQNRPYAQTLKALMVANAAQYSFNAGSTDNRREHQGWGFPDLKAMYDRRGKTLIIAEDDPLLQGQSASYTVNVAAGESELKACMTFLDPQGNPASALASINDLTLRVTSPGGTVYWGNTGLSSGNYSTSGGSANTIDTVENVFIKNPAAGAWTVDVIATLIAQDAHTATRVVDATYALCVVGGNEVAGSGCAVYVPSNTPASGICNLIPFGGVTTATLPTLFASNNRGSAGGAVYFDITVTNPIQISAIGVNTRIGVGAAMSMDIHLTAAGSTYSGNEAVAGAWTQVATATGVAAALDSASTLVLGSALTLQPGTYGVALVASGFGHDYTNGSGSNQTYSDSNVALSLGSATNVPFTAPSFSPRVANCELTYVTLVTGSLQTLFASNNGGNIGGAVYFDLTVTNPITLSQIDVNTAIGAGTAIGLDVHLTAAGSTYAGNETNAGAWALAGSGTGTAAAVDTPSAVSLTSPIALAPGTYGVALVATGFGHRYTGGNGSNQSYSDTNIALSLGSSLNVPFSGSVFTPRVANVDLHYLRFVVSSTWVNQRYQTIVRSSQLGGPGIISGLAFAPCGSGTHSSDRIQVTMSHVGAGWSLSNTFANNLPSPVPVLDLNKHVWHLAGDQWNEVGLMRRFKYNGTSDVVIDVTVLGNSTKGTSGGFHRDSNTPRVFATNWTGSVPGTATGSDNAGQKLRLEFGCANAHSYGNGCGGLSLSMSGQPVLGQSYSFDAAGGVPGASIWLNLGFDNGAPLYPWDLTPLGYTGCSFYHNIVATVVSATGVSGAASVNLNVPNNPGLIGAKLYGQFVQLNGTVPGGAAFSGYGRALHGTQ